MKTGITGLSFSGKTTLFCALTGQDYDALGHGRDVHIGTVKVPDERLEKLFEMIKPKKITHATMEFFDIAGQTGGGEKTIEPKSLQAIRNAESLIVVLDGFSPGADPKRDFDTLIDEYIFNDLVVATNRLERLEKEMRSGGRDELIREKAVLETCRDILENGGILREHEFEDAEEKLLRGFQFITLKPLLVVINVAESDLGSGRARELENLFAGVKETACTAICCEIEMEIAMLDESDRADFLVSMGITEPALGKLIRMSYDSLGLLSFFTAGGPDEVRAWTVRKGSNAQECAGAIHSDLARGFIRAETVAYEDYVSAGTFKDARERGLLRVEGRDYIVKAVSYTHLRAHET